MQSLAQAPAEIAGSFLVRQGGTSALVNPNALVRFAFYCTAFSIPFTRVYLPGTGDRLGVIRLVQLLLLASVISQPRACIRFIPVAFFSFGAYVLWRISAGLWLTPELADEWWPTTLGWLQFSLPCFLVLFNVLQNPSTVQPGLWAFVWGAGLCALLHVLGIGVFELDGGVEGRSTVFGENANVVGGTYGLAMVALTGLCMLRSSSTRAVLAILPLMALLGIGLAKTGSRTGLLLVSIGLAVLLFRSEMFISPFKRYAGLAAAVLLFGFAVSQVPSFLNRLSASSDMAKLQREEGRARMAPVLWDIYLRAPLFGTGPDKYQFELTRRAMPHLIRSQKTIAAHNMPLFLLVETGVIGLVLFASGLWMALKTSWRSRNSGAGLLPFALLLPLLLAALTVSNPVYSPVFWFVMAYALAAGASR